MTGPLTRRIAERKLRQRITEAKPECVTLYVEASELERQIVGRDDRPEWLRRLSAKELTFS